MHKDKQIAESGNEAPSVRRRLTMPAVVVGLLGGHVVFVMLAITLATGDRSFAVVPDYYQKAVDYDDRKQVRLDSEQLGWRAEVQPGKALDAVGERELVVVLRDREGQPVTGAQVQFAGYHFARASELIELEMTEILPGQYVGRGRLSRAGFWQLEINAEFEGQRFIFETKQFVSETEAKP